MDDGVIVVGGGVCGLICAATLARSGSAVQLIDAGAQPGGRASTSDVGGYLLNRGAHALYPSSERMLAAAGARISGGHPAPARTSLLFRGEMHRAGPATMLGRGPMTLRESRRVIAALAGAVLGSPSRSAGIDAASWASEHGRTALPTAVLEALLRLASYAGDLSLLPAEVGRELLREASIRPVRYVDGGWAAIADALAASARSAGAVLRPGVRAVALDCDGHGAVVGLAGGGEIRARTVVLAGLSPARAGRLLRQAGGRLPGSIEDPRPVHAACLDVALTGLPDPSTPLVIGGDEPLYMSVHSVAAKLAPDGGAVIHLLRYDDGRGGASEAVHERLRALLDAAQPGWRERLVHERFAPRMVVSHHLPAPGEGLAGRPGVSDTALPRVLIAGDWVGPTGWLAGAALASGVAAAHAAGGPSATATAARERAAGAA